MSVKRFHLYDESGNEYVAIRTESRVRTTHLGSTHHEHAPSLASVRLSDGRQLTSAGQGKYTISGTTTVLYPTKP